MLKVLIALLLGFVASLAGNLIAGWIQQDVFSNLFTLLRLLGTSVGALLALIAIALLESRRALTWNWRWHRFWYLRELMRHPQLRDWEIRYAQLELLRRREDPLGTEVICEGGRQDLIKVLHDLVSGRLPGDQRALVLGEPGSGKTTGLERLTFGLARDGVRHLGLGQLMPVLIRLGRFQEGRLLAHVSETVRHAAKGKTGEVLGKGVEELLAKGRIILLFDALDEALGERRELVLSELTSFLDSQAYARVPVVVTARIREVPGQGLDGLQSYIVQDLNDEAVQVFIQAYMQPADSRARIWKRLEGLGLLEPGGLGRNPFWLKLILASGTFQGNKGQILDKAVDVLLAREWDGKPRTDRAWERVLPRDEQLEETKKGLAWLGYQMSVEEKVDIDRDSALAKLEEWLKKRVGIERLRPQDILGLGSDAQILAYDSDPVSFRQRLLQEYHTAKYIVGNAAKGALQSLTRQYLTEDRWREVFLMTAEILGEADDFLLMAKNRTRELIVDTELAEFLKEIQGIVKRKDSPCPSSIFAAIAILSFIYYIRDHVTTRRDPQLEFELNYVLKFARPFSYKLLSSLGFANGLDPASCRSAIQVAVNRSVGYLTPSELVRGLDPSLLDTLCQGLVCIPDSIPDFNFDVGLRFSFIESLRTYLQANQLLLECLNTECYISEDTRQRILNELLTVPDSSPNAL